jgi:P27 family predicted phage terminase small subunit
MPKGPAPLPTKLKILQGNRGKRPLPENEPDPECAAPPKPEYLGAIAAVEWDRMVEITMDIGVLTVADGPALSLYCTEFETYRQAQLDLEVNGSLYKMTKKGEVWGAHPAVQIADKAAKNMKAILAEFGLTPSARTRVHTSKKKEKKGKFDDV